jgi:hypothetical protein
MPLGYLDIRINDFYFLRLPVQCMTSMPARTVDGLVINEIECAWVCVLTLSNWVHSARRPPVGVLYLHRVIMKMENLVE